MATRTSSRTPARRPRPPARSAAEHATPAVLAALNLESGSTVSGIATVTGLDRAVVTKTLQALAADGRVRRTPSTEGRTKSATWHVVPLNKSGTEKLRKGELAEQAVGFLREQPGVEFTPGEIGRKLGKRSPGAVLNALAKLVVTGEVVQTSERPVRFAVPAPASKGSRRAKR